MTVPVQCPACGEPIEAVVPAGDGPVHCPRCRAALPREGFPTAPLDPRGIETWPEQTPTVPGPGDTAVPSLGRIGRFELRAVLGQGTFGRVYRAYDPQLEREVALKVPRFGPDQPGQVERFLGEAKAAARLRHPNVVAVFESGRAGDEYYIASEFVEGRPLSDVLRESPPDFGQAARWVRDLARGLAYAHAAGVIHRDVKPANVLIDRAGRPQLTDFGLAKRVGEDATRTADGTVLGTPAYMAPEQARGDLAAVGPHSDQYGLGVVLYQLLSGRLPFVGPPHAVLAQVTGEDPPPPGRINPAVPRDLEAVCLKAMAKEPARRYAAAGDLADDLDRFLAGEPVRARRPGVRDRAGRWLRRHRQAAALAGGVAAAVLLTLAAVWWDGGFRSPLPPAEPAAGPPQPAEITVEDRQKIQASRQNLSTIGVAMIASESAFGYLPQPAIYARDGRPLLSWRVALLPYLDQRALYSRFKLDEPWDGPHNIELLEHMPKVYEVPGTATPKPFMTFYRVFVGPGAMFEPGPQARVRLMDIRDDRASTFLVVEAAEPVEWTRPGDLPFEAGKPLPALGGLVPDGFQACFGNGAVEFLKKEVYDDARTLRALVGRQDGELVDLRPYQTNPYRTAPRPAAGGASTEPVKEVPREVQDRTALALEAGRRNKSKNNLKQLGQALRKYQDTYGTLPPPALLDKEGRPLLSWRVALLPFLGQQALYGRFKLDEPWDGPTNRELRRFMPAVFAAPGVEAKDPDTTYYQLFVGPGAYDPAAKRRSLVASIPDGPSNTIAVAEAAEPVPWTAPADMDFGPDRPLPALGGLFADGFNAALFDGSVEFYKKAIYDDERALRALIGWDDGEVVNLRPYLEPAVPRLSKESAGAGARESAMRLRSMNSLRQLGLALHNYHDNYGRFPPYALPAKDGRPLLSWRVAVLPFLDQGPLYRKFHLDEPWDSPHNKALLPLMPRTFETAGVPDDQPDRTFYQVFVGPGAGFDRDPRHTLRVTQITDGTSATLMIAEAGAAVPWTKPEDLFVESGGPLPRLGGIFADGFHACTFDTRVHFLGRKVYDDEPALRALIGIADGKPADPDAFR
jgi:hypothetical protein